MAHTTHPNNFTYTRSHIKQGMHYLRTGTIPSTERGAKKEKFKEKWAGCSLSPDGKFVLRAGKIVVAKQDVRACIDKLYNDAAYSVDNIEKLHRKISEDYVGVSRPQVNAYFKDEGINVQIVKATETATVEIMQHIAGFFDGDGCVIIPPKREKDSIGPCPHVLISQSYNAGVPPEFTYIAKYFNGTLWTSDKAPPPNTRKNWKFLLQSLKNVTTFLKAISPYVIKKRRQVDLALEYLRGNRNIGSHADFKERISACTKSYMSVEVDTERLTHAYIAGLFEADGSILASKEDDNNFKIEARIKGLESPALIKAINEHYEYGCCTGGRWQTSSGRAIDFCLSIQPFVIGQKKQQIVLAMQMQALKTPGRKTPLIASEIANINELREEMKRLKRL
jgi:hypothetical protein